ncbi:hypothetical protein A7X88_06825 [Stenotrophomonas maltophilia]|nr:hypothetical protein A7X88_06825 [Stenotrophomonas maltophilia]
MELGNQLLHCDLALNIQIMPGDYYLEILTSLRGQAKQRLAQRLDPSTYGTDDNGQKTRVFALTHRDVRHMCIGSFRPRKVSAYELIYIPIVVDLLTNPSKQFCQRRFPGKDGQLSGEMLVAAKQ